MTLQPYEKPFFSFDQQLDQLQARGLLISNRREALEFLRRVNYFRLQAYWYQFEVSPHPEHTLKPGTTFDDIRSLYLFDGELRSQVFAAIVLFESCFRTRLAYCLAERKGDPFAHLDSANYRTDGKHRKHWHDVLKSLRKKAVARANEHDPRILHFHGKYQSFPDLPVWAMVEVASFGDLSKLYNALTSEIEQRIARFFGISGTGVLGSWLHNVNTVRNHCAHHNRLWDFRNPHAVRYPPEWQAVPDPQTLFASLLCIYSLIARWDLEFADSWRDQVSHLIANYLAECPLAREFQGYMGLLPNWQTHPIWHASPPRQ